MGMSFDGVIVCRGGGYGSGGFIWPNSLDNGLFTRLINQQGFSGTLSTVGNIFDRWKLVSGTVEITDAGLVLNGTMAQVLEYPLLSTAWTAMALTTEGVVEASYDNDAKTYTMTGEGQTFVAAYLGDRADQKPYVYELGAWVINYPVRPYAEELAVCQRYLRILFIGSDDTGLYADGISKDSTIIWATYEFLPPMRAVPVLTGNTTGRAVIRTSIGTDATAYTNCPISIFATSKYRCNIQLTLSTALSSWPIMAEIDTLGYAKNTFLAAEL